MSSQYAFICRPTGTLGTAVTKALLCAGYTIHALVHDLEHERSRAYQALSPEHIRLFKGSVGDEVVLMNAMKECTSVFLNIMPNFADPNAEISQGRAVIKAAQTIGVQHIVYVSLLGLDILTSQGTTSQALSSAALFEGKVTLEAAVKGSDIKSWMILRPGYFMSNFLPPFNQFYWPGLVSDGRAESSYALSTVLNLTDPQDVAKFVVAAFEDPGRYYGEVLSLISQRLEVEQAIDELRKASGKEILSVYRSEAESNALMAKTPLIAAQLFLRDSTAMREMEEPRGWGVPLGTFAEFLRREINVVSSMFAEAV